MDIKDYFKTDNFAAETGVELLEAGAGRAKARMEILPKHLNGGGVCQGGAIFTLADFAFAVAVNSHAELTLSIQSEVRFFKAESVGFLYAEAKEIHRKGHISSAEVKISNEAGELVAVFSGLGYNKRTVLPFEI
ncbi:MAG: PaaI family thioesterase [Dysgonamonadaceae bacterium]|jgi:acyl-CoA thioesterase|nr:PaaI family thioesterase [Dysgonamonadaceae bacterium]